MTTVNLAGMTGEQQAQALIAQGWTWDQVRAQYPQLFGVGGAGIPGTALVPTTQPGIPSFEQWQVDHPKRSYAMYAAQYGLQTVAPGTGAGGIDEWGTLPAGVAAGLGAVGVGAGTIAGLGIVYGVTQMMGVQYPWETGPGEGFIAPWERDIVQDESGLWVTRETRPDLFPANGNGRAMVPFAAGALGGVVVKTWSANGWPFAMTSDGYIHTITKSGLMRKYKPYKSVVLGKNPSPKMLNRAVTKLIAFDKLHSRIQKMARRIKT